MYELDIHIGSGKHCIIAKKKSTNIEESYTFVRDTIKKIVNECYIGKIDDDRLDVILGVLREDKQCIVFLGNDSVQITITEVKE